ncbi:hypothetical protein ACLOJK_020173 [Asimina triloba]
MGRRHWRGNTAVVAIDASKEITDYALEWTIRNAIKLGDTLILLALLPSKAAANRDNHSGIQHFFTSFLKWGSRREKVAPSQAAGADHGAQKITEVCMQMINQLCETNLVQQVETHVKIVADAQMGSVATKVTELGAAWVILDRRLKKEADICLKQLSCNIILIDHAIPKILRLLNPSSQPSEHPSDDESLQEDSPDTRKKNKNAVDDVLAASLSDSKPATPLSSLGLDSQSPETDASDSPSTVERDEDHHRLAAPSMPLSLLPHNAVDLYPQQPTNPAMNRSAKSQELRWVSRHDGIAPTAKSRELLRPQPKVGFNVPSTLRRASSFKPSNDNDGRSPTPLAQGATARAKSRELRREIKFPSVGPAPGRKTVDYGARRSVCVRASQKPPTSPHVMARRSVDLRPRQRSDAPPPHPNAAAVSSRRNYGGEKKQASAASVVQPPVSSPLKAPVDRTSSIRRAISLSIKQPPTPPPLCSLCKHNAPIFGKPPRKFSYEEMVAATDGFSSANFLAEGGYGPVYRGVLPDGQVVAVKQHKMVSAQGASEFCAEVEVLSCAQHRNLVMLVGYCMEKEWLLVYEFACNGSLDTHLYGKKSKEVMAWQSRMKVAIGAARGLRYLHEDCRVGCIVHRDLRPNNILLTHDFEAMVGDFGLARWQADGTTAEETRVVGTLGYLAPEYTRTGQITEKADVYAFGVLLLELVCGLKTIDFSRSNGQQYLLDWARPLMKKKMVYELIDPRLDGDFEDHEAERLVHAAGLCISSNPEKRPRMSMVLRILEGDVLSDLVAHGQLQHALTCAESDLAQSPRMSVSKEPPNKTRGKQRFSEAHGIDHCRGSGQNKQMISNTNEAPLSNELQAYLQGSLAEFIENKIKR